MQQSKDSYNIINIHKIELICTYTFYKSNTNVVNRFYQYLQNLNFAGTKVTGPRTATTR